MITPIMIINNYIIDSPTASNLSYIYNIGSILGLILIIQIITGILLGFYYCSDITMAFDSIEHINRDVNYGFALRYTHANGAAIIFIFVYIHIGKAIYYGSYNRISL
jgi:quinol-cytochrome oxidoreductase complex cytochrome b subunit